MSAETTKTFGPDAYARALESWHWIGIEGKRPLFASLFGDVFLEDEDGVWWLDIGRGELVRPRATREEMDVDLASRAGQDEFLLAALAEAASDAGLRLAADEIYDFRTPPILGGEYAVENLQPLGFEVALSLAGQIHDQVKELPDGAEISLEMDWSDERV